MNNNECCKAYWKEIEDYSLEHDDCFKNLLKYSGYVISASRHLANRVEATEQIDIIQDLLLDYILYYDKHNDDNMFYFIKNHLNKSHRQWYKSSVQKNNKYSIKSDLIEIETSSMRGNENYFQLIAELGLSDIEKAIVNNIAIGNETISATIETIKEKYGLTIYNRDIKKLFCNIKNNLSKTTHLNVSIYRGMKLDSF